jgi:hypothetical protein
MKGKATSMSAFFELAWHHIGSPEGQLLPRKLALSLAAQYNAAALRT